jgi:hypothetical protein
VNCNERGLFLFSQQCTSPFHCGGALGGCFKRSGVVISRGRHYLMERSWNFMYQNYAANSDLNGHFTHDA